VKKAVLSIKAPAECELDIHYLGAPRYQITLTAKDFKEGQKAFDKLAKSIEQKAKKEDLLIAWEEDE